MKLRNIICIIGGSRSTCVLWGGEIAKKVVIPIHREIAEQSI